MSSLMPHDSINGGTVPGVGRSVCVYIHIYIYIYIYINHYGDELLLFT